MKPIHHDPFGAIIYKLTRPYKAFLLIDQGSNNDRIPQPQDDFVALTAMVAVGIGSVTADLQDIPNGPIRFMVFTSWLDICIVYDERPLSKLQSIKSSNNTHGYIRATVDFSIGPEPISAIVYRARTLDDKRRDFRLLIGNPNDPKKAMANPVFWFSTNLVTEEETKSTIICSLTIENPTSGWEGFLIQANFLVQMDLF
ncbi:hypothetical protein I4U23_017308 [Adineta vaga]|nr:hypothetical protein I4U23_017308 [Adineta vaga]